MKWEIETYFCYSVVGEGEYFEQNVIVRVRTKLLQMCLNASYKCDLMRLTNVSYSAIEIPLIANTFLSLTFLFHYSYLTVNNICSIR